MRLTISVVTEITVKVTVDGPETTHQIPMISIIDSENSRVLERHRLFII